MSYPRPARCLKNAPTALLHDSINCRQTQARTFSDVFRREKRIESTALDLWRHPRPRVTHSQRNVVTRSNVSRFAATLFHFPISDLDGQLASFRHGVTSVCRQVHQDLLDLGRIGPHRGQLPRQNNANLDVFANHSREHEASFPHYRIEIKDQWRRYLLTTEGEELFCQTYRPLRCGGDSLDILSSWIVGAKIFQKEFRTSQNYAQ